jgi:hypothetical protein
MRTHTPDRPRRRGSATEGCGEEKNAFPAHLHLNLNPRDQSHRIAPLTGVYVSSATRRSHTGKGFAAVKSEKNDAYPKYTPKKLRSWRSSPTSTSRWRRTFGAGLALQLQWTWWATHRSAFFATGNYFVFWRVLGKPTPGNHCPLAVGVTLCQTNFVWNCLYVNCTNLLKKPRLLKQKNPLKQLQTTKRCSDNNSTLKIVGRKHMH